MTSKLREAAEAGDAKAAFNLAKKYSRGDDGLAMNKALAAKYYQMASDGGHRIATFNLASLYVKGDGVATDRARALALYKLCAESGDAQATYFAGTLLEDSAPAEALSYYRRAAELGFSRAAVRGGRLLLEGAGPAVPASAAQAAQVFYLGAKNNDANSAYELGLLMADGAPGVVRDLAKAAVWMKVAADGNHEEAFAWLGKYESGAFNAPAAKDTEKKSKKTRSKPGLGKTPEPEKSAHAGKAPAGGTRSIATLPPPVTSDSASKPANAAAPESEESTSDSDSDADSDSDDSDEEADGAKKEGDKDSKQKKKKRSHSKKVEEIMARLDAIVGLDDVKEQIRTMKNQIELNRLRKKMGMEEEGLGTLHMAFIGNPGVGKTTVARIVADLLKSLKVLSKGQLVEVNRGQLVAEYAGQTAPRTTAVCESALGGVLFIDEAYALAISKEDSYGKEAIDTLVPFMENHREDLLVIVAGYKKEMQQFFDANTGLKSRFMKSLIFQDYNAAELLQIADIMIKGANRTITPEAHDRLAALLAREAAKPEQQRRESGNGRFVRNVLEQMKRNQANRLVASLTPKDRKKLTKEALSQLELSDVPEPEGGSAAATSSSSAPSPAASSDDGRPKSAAQKKLRSLRDQKGTHSKTAEDGWASSGAAALPAEPVSGEKQAAMERSAWSAYSAARSRSAPSTTEEHSDDEDDE
jgi:TPR repeat protein/Holliday junction resolvasome RuvABC ATP-dependent DNA helicase subunit